MTKRDWLLWAVILAPPAAWALNLMTNFALSPVPCTGGGPAVRRLVSIAAALVAAASAWAALSLRRRCPAAQGAPSDRARAMELAGVVIGLAFLLAIIAGSLPDYLLSGCE